MEGLRPGQMPVPIRPRSLQAELTEQYFADYSEHWQQFMTGFTWWEAASTLPGVIDQLKLMADARLSPVIALMMKSLEYQGNAGTRKIPCRMPW
ncbi:ImcF-related family protein [Cupriavidus basilensis]